MTASESREAGPLLTVIALSAPGRRFDELEHSLLGQSNLRFELIVADHEPRLDMMISKSLQMVRGKFLLIVRRDVALASDTIEHLEDAFRADDLDVLYSDEEIRRKKGGRPYRLLKPDFSPERLRCEFYIGEAIFYRARVVKELGIASDVPGAELYDLALRATSGGGRVEHTGIALLSFPPGSELSANRDRPSDAVSIASTRRVLERRLAETGGGIVAKVLDDGVFETHRRVLGSPLVSIIIPSRGSQSGIKDERKSLLINAVASILEKSTYDRYEIVVVLDDVASRDVVDRITSIGGDRLRIVWWREPFNFSAKVNYGAFCALGDYYLFLNDDTEVISSSWIEALLALCQLPGAGMSGAMLYFEDDTIQHAGHLYEGKDAGHIGTNERRGARGPHDALRVEREVSGVTAACSMMPREVFDAVGGFSLLFPNNFNDVDLCMKVGQLGHTIYWTPRAELFHFESKSRSTRVSRYEVETLWSRWEWKLNDLRYWPYGATNI